VLGVDPFKPWTLLPPNPQDAEEPLVWDGLDDPPVK
jgi:hypothetical protein